jgi:hypothetical protein
LIHNFNILFYRLSLAVQSLLLTYKWTEISLIYSPDIERQVCVNFVSAFEVRTFGGKGRRGGG